MNRDAFFVNNALTPATTVLLVALVSIITLFILNNQKYNLIEFDIHNLCLNRSIKRIFGNLTNSTHNFLYYELFK